MRKIIRLIAKKIVPEKIRVIRTLFIAYSYDIFRYYKYSNSYKNINSIGQFEALMIFYYHVAEKGLTMPEPRLGFGQRNIENLIDICFKYIKKGYDVKRMTFTHSLGVLSEYLTFHEEKSFSIDILLKEKIHKLQEHCAIQTETKQLKLTSHTFFKDKYEGFEEFCQSRHTVRNYSNKDIPREVFDSCVSTAQKTPSACNRQPNRVYVIKNNKLKEKVLALQNGNRGFGSSANALVIFTSDISCFRFQIERNDLYLNSGLYIMSFIYALHSNKIGSCALNWSVIPSIDRKLRRLLNIPANETITLLLSCGYLPEELKIASSPRKGNHEILTYL